MEWENLLSDTIVDGKIRELYLKKIPVLRTCNNWKEVEPIGWVDHKMSLSHYKGGLVRLGDKIFFVKDITINALSAYMEWKFPQKIEVTED
ncbi:MAG: hypothetical protein SVZ03_04485 [Spirochaetota bacterium]|nr:hypothetical protein [Spirochaetota bacterium]